MQELVNSFDRFMHNMPEAIIIWGAGIWGRFTYDWFHRLNMEHKIICFIDTNPKLQGSLLFGKKILPPGCLTNYTSASVIASLILWNEIHEAMLNNGFQNPFYVAIHYWSMDMPQNKDDFRFRYSIDDVSTLYAPGDAYTKAMIISNNFMRENIAVIVPIETMLQNKDLCMTASKPLGYWEAEETRLDRFGIYTLIDGGAYIGDSLQAIARSTKSRLSHAYCFEPDNQNAERLRQYINEEGLSDIITIFERGLGENSTKAAISNTGTAGASLAISAGGTIDIASIDSLDLEVAGKLCIKLDIEGFELAALRGAAKTIRKYKPELAICVYHKTDDIYEIPYFIKSIVPEYNCILRGSWHTLCVASVERYGTL